MRLYNTLTKQKEEFIPLHPGEVRMYNCGPTVYDYFHIGNARNFIVFDCLRRYFEYKGYKVTFVQNFTDIDDKMIKRANEEDTTVAALSEQYIGAYEEDAEALGITPATHHPKATEHMDDIIAFVKELVDKGYAYAVTGDVYFDTTRFAGYGALSGQDLSQLESGARVEIDTRKRNPMDFALWKSQKPGEPAWESPWGLGRPGWHIECSVMATHYLGETIDIHSGGEDLVFPHHENEKAQSEALTGKPFARYWLHNGFLNIEKQKMSKSLGNFFTVRDIEKEFDPQVIRLFMLSAHYRSPLNFSRELMEAAKNALMRIQNFKTMLDHMAETVPDSQPDAEESAWAQGLGKYRADFEAAMEDDINTADALAAIYELVRDANTYLQSAARTKKTVEVAGELFEDLSDVLGISVRESGGLEEEIESLIEKRQQARAEKNWAEADRIRDDLKERGIVLEDTPQGVRWKRA